MSASDPALLPVGRPTATSLAGEVRALVRLAFPVVVVQVGIMAMGTVDTMFVGRISATALAGVALGNYYFFLIAVFGMGLLLVLDPVIAQAIGARNEVAVARGVQRGLLLAVGVTGVASLCMVPAEPIFRLLRQPAEIIPIATRYVWASIPGVLPFYVFVVFRQTLQARRRLAAVVLTIIAANLLNALFNWMFIYGHAGAPALGPVGSAWASTVSRWTMCLLLTAAGWTALRPSVLPWRGDALRWRPLWRMIKLGAPIGWQQQLEVGVFVVVAVMMGGMGPTQLAAHQVAINIAALTFMVPLGVAGAAAVLVGHGVGRGDARETRRAARAAFVCGVGFMMMSTLVFIAFPRTIAGAFTSAADVLTLAAVLIPIAGVFQVFDGVQAVAGGVLRGLGETRSSMIANAIGFWMIGLPLSVYLGFHTHAGPRGLWWGLVAGLGAVALMLVARVWFLLRRELRSVIIDDDSVHGGDAVLASM